MKKALQLIVSLVVTSLFVVGCQSTEESMTEQNTAVEQNMQSVTGTIAYRERLLLPENAQVTVTLQDVSKMDAAAEVIAQQQFSSDGHQVPLAFDLMFDSNRIQPRHRYSVSARIEVNGKLRFITDTQYAVLTDENKTTHVDLRLVGVRAK